MLGYLLPAALYLLAMPFVIGHCRGELSPRMLALVTATWPLAVLVLLGFELEQHRRERREARHG